MRAADRASHKLWFSDQQERESCGNAQWMRVFVGQMPRKIELDESLTTNPVVVPMDAAQLAFEWQLVQADPIASGNGRRNRGRHQGGSTLDPATRAVVRRYEMYNYVAAYDPITNEALCVDLLCKVPDAAEIGDFISGNIGGINCGNACSAALASGTVVTLTAIAPAGKTFSAWSGACTGAAPTCSVTVTSHLSARASFNK
jgi:Divergent InlB B-repeat domain